MKKTMKLFILSIALFAVLSTTRSKSEVISWKRQFDY